MSRYYNRGQGKDSTIEPAYLSDLSLRGEKMSGEGTTETVRYMIEKIIENGETTYRLKQIINGQESYSGDTIILDPSSILVDQDGKTLAELLAELDSIANKNKPTVNSETESLTFP